VRHDLAHQPDVTEQLESPAVEPHLVRDLPEHAALGGAGAVHEDVQSAPAGPAANIAKLAASDAALEAFDISLQAHGGNGFTSDYDLLDIYSFLRLQRTAPVSREMILNYIGEHLLGMPKSY
jgi:acyl-CoA dehydrogenase